MDIRKFKVEPTSVLHLRGANDELLYADGADGKPDLTKPMQVHVFGPGSKPYANAQAKSQNRMIDMLKRKGKTDQSADQRRKEQAELLVACTKQFENVEYDKLENEALAMAVYTDLEIGFIAEQVSKHLGDWANFSKPTSTPT